MVAEPCDGRLRRLLLFGQSFGAKLARHSTVPVLYLPGAEIFAPAQAGCAPETLYAVQSQLLIEEPACWQQPSAAAA